MLPELTAGVEDAMRVHATAARPLEACGAVFGTVDAAGHARTTRYHRLRNTAADAGRAFALDPLELCAIDGGERDAGRVLLGLFHSHPEGRAAASEVDRAGWWPGGACWIGAFDRRGAFRLATLPVVGSRLLPAR